MQAETSQCGLTKQEQQQEFSGLNASTNALLAKNGAQIAAAAGSSLLAQDAPLTDNAQLLDPEVDLQNITVDLNSVPLPTLPPMNSTIGSGGPQASAPGGPMLPEVVVSATRLPPSLPLLAANDYSLRRDLIAPQPAR